MAAEQLARWLGVGRAMDGDGTGDGGTRGSRWARDFRLPGKRRDMISGDRPLRTSLNVCRTVERWEAVSDAVILHRRGLAFADALHWTSSAACSQFMSFNDRRFVRRARRLKLAPEVISPK